MKYASHPHNPDIANAFFRAGLIESWGRGIERITEACAQDGYPAPAWALEPGGWWVTFSYPAEVAEQVTPQVEQLLQALQGETTHETLMAQLGLRDREHFRVSCSIPDDCIDFKCYPLFIARAVLQELVESLQSNRGVTPC